ncbi:MAG TPA: RNA degradosome polyphosphate kinase, partial [Nitratifractor sp.]|nr:RNA degradosome polyphosphate kinase [Nitratifractor sp.]
MSVELDDANLYINRELSWLNFNKRVLDQATYKGLLPLDRLKFLAIYGTNLDEFYMIRVAGLKALYKAGVNATGPDKLTPIDQLTQLRDEIRNIMPDLESIYLGVKKELEESGVSIKHFSELNEEQKSRVSEHFFEHIYPIIIPIAVDATHPFPHLNNLSFGIALELKGKDGQMKHGLVRIPRIVSRFIHIDNTFVLVDSVVEHFSSELFPGFTPVASAPFRVTRYADMDIEEEEADDFLGILEEGLRSRNKG